MSRTLSFPLILVILAVQGFCGDFSTLTDNTWTRIADSPGDALGRDVPPGRAATWVYVPATGKFLRFGGYTPMLSNALDEFDPVAKSWTRLFPLDENYPADRPGGGCDHMMAWDSVRQVVWICGGFVSINSGDNGVWKFDPVAKTFTKAGPALGYNTHYAFDKKNGLIVAIPGSPSRGAPARRTMVFSPETGAWEERVTAVLPQDTYMGGLNGVYDPSIERIMVLRGLTTWNYDIAGNAWAQVATTGAPPVVMYMDTANSSPMAYDPQNQVILCYGNSDGRLYGSYHNQTWIYKGTTQTWTRVNCPGVPVSATAKAGVPMFYHKALDYYLPGRCFLLCDPDLGVWAFRYNPAAAAGTTAMDAESLVVGEAASNTPATGPSDILRTLPSPLNQRFLNMPDNTLYAIAAGIAPGDEVGWDFDPDNGIITKYGGCGNGTNPLFNGYGSSLCFFDPGTETWHYRRVSDVSGYNRPAGGCGRSTIYDTRRKQWWLLGGGSGEPYPCQGPGSDKPWSYDFSTDLFTSHHVPTSPALVSIDGLEGGVNLRYSPEFDLAVFPAGDSTTWEFSFETHQWTVKNNTSGPGHLPEHAGSIAWVPTLHAYLCFSQGKTWAYYPDSSRWVDLDPANPPPSREVKMGFAYDSVNDIVLLVAGFKRWNEDPVNDMWAYHPSTNAWEALDPVPAAGGAKPSRGCQQTAYDSRHNVFFIGMESSNSMFAYRYKAAPLGVAVKTKAAAENGLAASPNPFRSSTLFTVRGPAQSLKVFDSRGRLVRDLTAGISNGRAEWKAESAGPGLYFAVLKTGAETHIRKCLVVK